MPTLPAVMVTLLLPFALFGWSSVPGGGSADVVWFGPSDGHAVMVAVGGSFLTRAVTWLVWGLLQARLFFLPLVYRVRALTLKVCPLASLVRVIDV